MKEAANQAVPVKISSKARKWRISADAFLNMATRRAYASHSSPICHRLLNNDQPSAFSTADWVNRCMLTDFSGYLIIAVFPRVRRELPCDCPATPAELAEI